MSNLENHNPQVIRQISKEVRQLTTEKLEGIKIQVNESNLTDIQAVIDGPGNYCETFYCLVEGETRTKHFVLDIDPIHTIKLRTFITYALIIYFSLHSVRWWTIPRSIDLTQRFPNEPTQGLFLNKDFPSKRCEQWRNLCQHFEERLEVRPWN